MLAAVAKHPGRPHPWLTTCPGWGLLSGDFQILTDTTAPCALRAALPVSPPCPRYSKRLWGARGERLEAARAQPAVLAERTASTPGCLLSALFRKLSVSMVQSQPHPHATLTAAGVLGMLPGGATCQHEAWPVLITCGPDSLPA